MNKIKRVLSVVLSVLMMVSMLAVCQISFTFAATENGYTYDIIADNTARIIGYTGSNNHLEVPNKLGGLVVTAIGDYAFEGNNRISTITIPWSVASVGECAFANCAALTDITFFGNPQTFGDAVFMNCTALTEISIGGSASVELGMAMFSGCTSLEELALPSATSMASLFDGSVSTNAGFPATLKTITILNGDSVAPNAFYGMKDVETIRFNTSITTIGAYAFANCSSLKTLVVSLDKLSSVSEGAFKGCTSLASFKLPSKATTVGVSAFEGCTALADITVTDNLKYVGVDAFKGTAWLAAQPAGAVTLGKVFVAFNGKDKVITIPTTVSYIADSALRGNTTVKEVVIPSNITYIGTNLLTGTATEKLTVPYIGPANDSDDSLAISYYFGGTAAAANATVMPASFKEVVITSCDSIPNHAFEGAKYITTVSIPSSITSIGASAFKNCAALKTVNYDAVDASVATDAFSGSPVSNLNLGENVKVIPTYLCTANTNLSSITIPAFVTEIESRAFAGCYNITTINYNAVNCNSIANNAFEYCHRVNNVVLGENVKHVPANLFSLYSGANVKSMTIPENITSIADGAFSNCTALNTLYFDAPACDIGDNAFNGCINLSNVVLGKKVTTIPSNLFAGNKAISKLNVPATVERIDDSAFANCTNLSEITVPDSLLDVGSNVITGSKLYNLQGDGPLYLGKICIGYKGALPQNNSITVANGTLAISDGAFKGMSSLASVFVPSSVSYIGDDAFANIPASITCYSEAKYVIKYAQQNGISCRILNCTHSNAYYEIVTKATAESAGTWDKKCPDCEQTLASGVEYAMGEDANVWVLIKAATCTASGVLVRNNATKSIPALGHKKSVWKETKAATCAADGQITEFCADCDTKLLGVKALPKLDHIPGTWTVIKQPRTYCEGMEVILCTDCGEVLKSRKIDKLVENDVIGIDYSDLMSSEWYYSTVQFVLNNKLMNGVSDYEFDPNGTMTRAMFVTVIGRMAGVEVDNSVKTKFTDVKKNQYYTGYVAWAVENNIVNGVTNETFAPNDPITREQICTMIVRYADYSGIVLTAKNEVENFRDANAISKYAIDGVQTCQKAGIVKGRGQNTFAPQEKATRAEVAQILKNLALGFLAD